MSRDTDTSSLEKVPPPSSAGVTEHNAAAVRLRKLMATALQTQDIELALELAEAAGKIQTKCKGLHYLRALIFLKDNRLNEGKQALEKELELFSDCAHSRELLHMLKKQTTGADVLSPSFMQSVTMKNAIFKGKHRGERCFIVCNAPSINNYDLELLKNDTVFAVSNGYLHEKYSVFKPKYHCIPQITYAEQFTEEVTLRWFKEMHENIGDSTLFLASQEYEIVQSNNLFAGRNVHYVDFCLDSSFRCADPTDISGRVPGVWSVSIMCFYIALYMEFNEIYILGADHDYIVTGKYAHFYEKSCNSEYEFDVDEHKNHIGRTYTRLKGLYALFSQYEIIKNIASSRKVNIYNASVFGLLDTFPRVKFEELF